MKADKIAFYCYWKISMLLFTSNFTSLMKPK